MEKKKFIESISSGWIIFLCTLSLSGVGCGQKLISRSLPVLDFQRGKLEKLAVYDPEDERYWQLDVRSYDLSALSLKDRSDDLMMSCFDSKTKWSKDLPPSFNAKYIMELGKNPGLGIRTLHRMGITGKGVYVGLIDQGLLTQHVEYKDRLRFYEEIHCLDDEATMHGPATASILAGKTAGVAPEATLYYIATTMHDPAENKKFELDLKYLAQSINRLLDINNSLPKERRIRAIAVAIRLSNDVKNADLANDAVERAKKAGVFVITSSLFETHGFKFSGLNRIPIADPEKPSSYTLGSFLLWKNRLTEILKEDNHERLLIPMDSRCTASPTGKSDYAFYRKAGHSWVIPYIAGLYVLACQVKPDVEPETFWRAAISSGNTLEMEREKNRYCLGQIVNPEALIRQLQNAK